MWRPTSIFLVSRASEPALEPSEPALERLEVRRPVPGISETLQQPLKVLLEPRNLQGQLATIAEYRKVTS